MTKSLLLKGLAGVAAIGGAATGGIVAFNKGWFGGKAAVPQEPKSENVSDLTDKDLIDKAGLNCQLNGDALAESDSKECSVKEGSTLRIMVGNQEEEGVTFNTPSGSAKLKVSRSKKVGDKEETETHTKELKFVVDSGDITLSKEGGSPAITKLEQFETYEIFLRDKKFYLRRKTDAKVGKKNALGLGECELPDAGVKDKTCTFSDEKNIKEIKFDGQTDGISVSNGSIGLKLSSMSDSDTDFGDDKYRFTFKFPSDVTINSKQLKANIPYDFKIKKQANSNTLTLEKAWGEDSAFTKKAGLKCESNNECTVPADSQNLNVKVGNQKKEGITSLNGGNGKIKMEKDQAGYNQGLKFTITTADISLSSGTPSGTDIQKLEELETYEITEEGGKYYLTRKTSREESIKSSLVLPQGCNLPTDAEVNCTLTADDFKKINFDGKSGESFNGQSMTLKISKATNTTDFPLGYKFTFKTETEATISSSNKIKANVPTDFKIKKEDGKALSLEKAWSDTKFAEKVGLTCTSGTDTCCSKTGTSEKLNVKRGNDVKTDIDSVSTSGSGKIKVEKDQAGYNQGLKFTITGGDVSLTGGTAKSGSGNIEKLEELETYEITEEGDKYYLTRKTEAIKTIESQLGLTDAGCSLSTSSSSCSLNTENFKKINFDGKENPSSTGTVNLTISKTDKKEDFPLGYKFTLKSTTGDITIKSSSNVVKQNISTDFKIKKGGSGQSTTLTLEKAWTADSLGAKVGLKCCDNTSGECTIDGTNSKKLRVRQLSEQGSEIKQTALTKKTSNGGSGKIKVTKDQADYNQGFKFEISDGSIELDGTTGSDENDQIKRLGEYETYEIKEIGTEWFLSIKKKADDFVLKELGLENISGCSSLKLPRGSSGDICRIQSLDDLKKIKFENATGHNWSGTVSKDNEVELEIKQDSNFPLGFKFTFTDSDGKTGVCLPDGSGGKVSLENNTSGVDYKIKKSTTGNTTTLCLEKKDGSGSSSGSCK